MRVEYNPSDLICSTRLPASTGSSTSSTPSQGWPQPYVIDQEITKDVLDILKQAFVEPNYVIDTMREAIYPWLPIIDIPKLEEQIRRLPHEPNAEVATLLLAMHLMNQFSTPVNAAYPMTGIDTGTEKCRRFFALLQLDRKDKLETIQAGIFLSASELNSGRFNEASLTVAVCANTGYRLNLYRTCVGKERPQLELDAIKRHMWFSIILLDR